DLVHGDLAGVHATGIAVHNLVRGFERMRELWSEPRWRSPSSVDAVVEQCLFAPPSVLRQAAVPGATVCGAVRAGTLVVLELEAARQRTPGGGRRIHGGTLGAVPGHRLRPGAAARGVATGDCCASDRGRVMTEDVIFTPLKFRNLTVKNRIFRSNISG